MPRKDIALNKRCDARNRKTGGVICGRPAGGGLSPVGDMPGSLLAALGGGTEQARLVRLWKNWHEVMGPCLAPLAQPLGHHKGILLVGAEDSMLAQDLTLMSGEILERANAFMKSPFFSSVRVSLILQKTVLNASSDSAGREVCPPLPDPESGGQKPASGRHLWRMDPDSPVARCYARFARNGTRNT